MSASYEAAACRADVHHLRNRYIYHIGVHYVVLQFYQLLDWLTENGVSRVFPSNQSFLTLISENCHVTNGKLECTAASPPLPNIIASLSIHKEYTITYLPCIMGHEAVPWTLNA